MGNHIGHTGEGIRKIEKCLIFIRTTNIQVMTSKLESELPSIPTKEQRSAVVAEVAQGVARAAGAVLSGAEARSGAWRDLLARSAQARNAALGDLVSALERAALLVAKSSSSSTNGQEEEEVTVASRNIREFKTLFF